MSKTAQRRSDIFLVPKTDRTSLFSAEDRAGVRVDADGRHIRLVVADGAGTAHTSGLLAELIVASFVDLPPGETPFEPVDNVGYRKWQREISERWTHATNPTEIESWYERKLRERGSAAAFAAAVIDGDQCWCVAVGDCCVFHIRTDPEPACVASFPVMSWTAFDSTPDLVQTVAQADAWPKWARFNVRATDVIVGASDGIAEWVLSAAATNPEVWRLLIEMGAADFDVLVAEERRLGAMVDDDAIVVRVTVGPGT